MNTYIVEIIRNMLTILSLDTLAYIIYMGQLSHAPAKGSHV